MIDTDKYEGHRQPWVFTAGVSYPMSKADIALRQDAPKLLAEVKRLRKVLELIAKEMPYDSWMHTLIKDVIGYEKWQAKEMKE